MTSDAAAPLALVTGVTGYIGGRLVPELLAAGYRVRAMARHPERMRATALVRRRRGRCRPTPPSRRRSPPR